MNVEQIGFEAWGEELPESGFEVFHLPEALAVIDEYASAECRLYAAKKGHETVGLLPLFVSDHRIGRIVVSPPPGYSIPRLGPLLMPNSPKRRKQEKLNQRLISGVLDDIDADMSTTLFRMLGPLTYTDPRPLSWNDLDIDPKFTYVIDTGNATDFPALMDQFSKSLRNKMRRLSDLGVSIEDEGKPGAVRIYQDVAARYREQDETPPVSVDFVRDMVEALDDRFRAYVARDPSGAYLGGILVLYSNDLAYFWQGGVRSSYEGVSVNTLIHRRILEDILTAPELDSVTGYDLVGANTERLCEYKAKFCGDLRPYYTAESSGLGMWAVKQLYRGVPYSFKYR